MKKRKLNYIIHNPNTDKATADYILKVFFESNKTKVENAVKEYSDKQITKFVKE